MSKGRRKCKRCGALIPRDKGLRRAYHAYRKDYKPPRCVLEWRTLADPERNCVWQNCGAVIIYPRLLYCETCAPLAELDRARKAGRKRLKEQALEAEKNRAIETLQRLDKLTDEALECQI